MHFLGTIDCRALRLHHALGGVRDFTLVAAWNDHRCLHVRFVGGKTSRVTHYKVSTPHQLLAQPLQQGRIAVAAVSTLAAERRMDLRHRLCRCRAEQR